jgi:hypothetical protein
MDCADARQAELECINADCGPVFKIKNAFAATEKLPTFAKENDPTQKAVVLTHRRQHFI